MPFFFFFFIIWTNAGILLIGPWRTNFIEILIGIQTFSFKKMHLKMSSAKWHPFCLSLNVLMCWYGWRQVPVDYICCGDDCWRQILAVNIDVWVVHIYGITVGMWFWQAAYQLNPICANFFRGNINMYLHLCHSSTLIRHMYFKSFLK